MLSIKNSLIVLFFISITANAQPKIIDSLKVALSKNKTSDIGRLNVLKEISFKYSYSNADSCAIFGQQYYYLAIKLNKPDDQEAALNSMANSYFSLGDYAKCFRLYLKVIKLADSVKSVPEVVAGYSNIGFVYAASGDYAKSFSYLQLGIEKWHAYLPTHKLKTLWEREVLANLFINMGELFLDVNKVDSAYRYLQLSYADCKRNNFRDLLGAVKRDLGEVETARGNKVAALKYYREAVSVSLANDDINQLSITYLSTANLFHKYKQQDSAEFYASKAVDAASGGKYIQNVLNAVNALYTFYKEDNNVPQAFKYLEIATTVKNNIYSKDKVKQILSIDFDEKVKQLDFENVRGIARGRVRDYFLIFGMAVFLFVAFMGWRESRKRAKANKQLQQQQRRLDLINQNLELMVYERTKDLEDKNKKLSEYSYYLSHQIRGPVATIQGLINIEKEGLIEQPEFTNMINICILDIDSKILEINTVLSDA